MNDAKSQRMRLKGVTILNNVNGIPLHKFSFYRYFLVSLRKVSHSYVYYLYCIQKLSTYRSAFIGRP